MRLIIFSSQFEVEVRDPDQSEFVKRFHKADAHTNAPVELTQRRPPASKCQLVG